MLEQDDGNRVERASQLSGPRKQIDNCPSQHSGPAPASASLLALPPPPAHRDGLGWGAWLCASAGGRGLVRLVSISPGVAQRIIVGDRTRLASGGAVCRAAAVGDFEKRLALRGGAQRSRSCQHRAGAICDGSISLAGRVLCLAGRMGILGAASNEACAGPQRRDGGW